MNTKPHGPRRSFEKVADIIRDAGGRIVGRTRLQKIIYILEVAGLGEGFSFEYRHYGPYSEDLASATRLAAILDLISEDEQPSSWGGHYSIYTVRSAGDVNVDRQEIARAAVAADPIELELAATALFLAREGEKEPWSETARRKPDKAAGGRVKQAQSLYERLRRARTPVPLPQIA